MEKLKLVEPNLENLTGGWVSKKPISFNETPLKKEVTEISEGLHLVKECLSESMTNKIIDYFSESKSFGNVSVQGFNDGGFNGEVGSVRTTLYNEVLSNEIFEMIKPSIQDAIGEISTNLFSATDAWQELPLDYKGEDLSWELVKMSPLLRYMIYSDGGQHYAHYDAGFIYPQPEYRTLKSVVIYLTTNNSGATRFIDDGQSLMPIDKRNLDDWSREVDLEMDRIEFESLPVKGSVVVFDHRMCHDVQKFIPENKDEKRIIIRTDLIYKLCSYE